MKKVVWKFGLIAGGLLSLMMLVTLPFHEQIGFENMEVVGYTTMVLSFLFVFFGVKSYRDNVAGGLVGFGRAFAVGSLITVVSSLCYVLTWQVIYYKITPDFAEKYQAHVIDQARASGASQAEIEQKAAQYAKYAEMYKNPLVNVSITFLEPLPVGLVITLVSAGILRRRRREEDEEASLATA